MHIDHLVGDIEESLPMSGHENARALFAQRLEQANDHCLARPVEVRSGFVEDDERFRLEEGGCEGDALALTDGKPGSTAAKFDVPAVNIRDVCVETGRT